MTNDIRYNPIDFVSLKVTETNPKFVGKGMALIDPKVVEEIQFTTGDVIEITTSSGKKKTFALLWSGQPEDYGMRIIRIDGYTRNNLGIGIDDHVKIRKAQNIKNAEQVVVSPTEELNIVGIEEYLTGILEGRVVSRGDVIPLNIMGRKTGLVVNSVMPSGTTSTHILFTKIPNSYSVLVILRRYKRPEFQEYLMKISVDYVMKSQKVREMIAASS